MRKTRQRIKPASLLITPMIDMFTVILIFLIASYSPEASKVKKSEQIRLPKSTLTLNKAPRLQIEVSPTYIYLNGQAVAGLVPQDPSAQNWLALKNQLVASAKFDEKGKLKDEPVLVMADKATSYQFVEKAISYVASSGFSEVYFLTEQEDQAREVLP